MLQKIYIFIDLIIWILFFIPTLYLFVFAAASLRKLKKKQYSESKKYRFAVLFPAYGSDEVILDSVTGFFKQDYPKSLYDIIVISDHLKNETDEILRNKGAIVIKAEFEQSSKAKALNLAMQKLDSAKYDNIILLDIDNLVDTDFLLSINNLINGGAKAIQTHRTAKNADTDVAVLDGLSEEINNAIFRKGHVSLSLSSALIGSGMVFDYEWFKNNISKATTAGEDKELELLLLEQGIHIYYAEDINVYDEKTRETGNFYNQRRRWIASQFYLISRALKKLPKALLKGNIDYCDKVFQWLLPPRLILIGIPLIMSFVNILFPSGSIYKWLFIIMMQFILFMIAIPKGKRVLCFSKALFKIPEMIFFTFINMLRLKGAAKTFIRTEHSQNID